MNERKIRGPHINYEDDNAALRTGYFYRTIEQKGIHILDSTGENIVFVLLYKAPNGRTFYCTKARYEALMSKNI